MAKVSDSRGSSYKDWVSSLGGLSYKKLQRPLTPVELNRKWPNLAEISILALFEA